VGTVIALLTRLILTMEEGEGVRFVTTSTSVTNLTCGGYSVHLFANQMDGLLISSYFSELWHSQMKEYKSSSRVCQ
jgi:hypothetical protein